MMGRTNSRRFESQMVPVSPTPRTCWVALGSGVDRQDRALVGGKGASLGQLIALGVPVPTAVALTTDAYRDFAASVGLPARFSDVPVEALPAIRAALLGGPMPAPVNEAIDAAFAWLRREAGEGLSLAVRSSGVAEDGADRSFAGLHDTVLDVRTRAELEAAVRQCWASLWSERAVAYRRGEVDTAEIAVVIQRLVRSDVAFVVFTVDPITGDERRAVISASWGLGEAIVAGLVTPDHIVVGLDGEIVEQTIGRKERMVIPGAAAGGTRVVPVPRLLQGTPALDTTQAAEIAALARSVSRQIGFPADIEGGIAGGEVFLFQARPITTLARHASPLATSLEG